jgi:hypothetical protein
MIKGGLFGCATLYSLVFLGSLTRKMGRSPPPLAHRYIIARLIKYGENSQKIPIWFQVRRPEQKRCREDKLIYLPALLFVVTLRSYRLPKLLIDAEVYSSGEI